jgi:hypothetical protein
MIKCIWKKQFSSCTYREKWSLEDAANISEWKPGPNMVPTTWKVGVSWSDT